jgi:hypothetical protein
VISELYSIKLRQLGISAMAAFLFVACASGDGPSTTSQRTGTARMEHPSSVMFQGGVPSRSPGVTLVRDANAWSQLVATLGPAHEELSRLSVDWSSQALVFAVLLPGAPPLDAAKIERVTRVGDRLEIGIVPPTHYAAVGASISYAVVISLPASAVVGQPQIVATVGTDRVLLPVRN